MHGHAPHPLQTTRVYVYDRWDPLDIWEVMLALLLMPCSFLPPDDVLLIACGLFLTPPTPPPPPLPR